MIGQDKPETYAARRQKAPKALRRLLDGLGRG